MSRQLFYAAAPTVPLRSALNRCVLLIGDGTAEGVGDALGKMGLVSRLTGLLADEPSLRLSWRVISAGKLWTTASDWHPTKGSLLQKTLSNQRFRDAEVVVLIFGMHDNPATAPEHVAAIADSLVHMGKQVVVPGFFNPYAPNTERHGMFRNATIDLKRHLSQYQQRVASQECESLSFGVDQAKVCVMGTDTLSEENGFCTFNPRGYRLFASDLCDDIVSAAKRVEWRYWKQQLSPRPS